MLTVGDFYTREKIWKLAKPGVPYSKGGPWATGYAIYNKYLFAFANIGDPGRTGHDFPNRYERDTGQMTWYGKPNSHSAQPTFRKLFEGTLKLMMFVRWENKNPNWLFLGTPHIESYRDNELVDQNTRTIRLDLIFKFDEWQDEQTADTTVRKSKTEGERKYVLVSRYERDPRLRAQAIMIHGTSCFVCGFDFGEKFGDIGEGFCHIHHIKPLGEVAEVHNVDPNSDLVPVCPNCHAMLHRKNPALKVEELKSILNNNRKKP